MNPDWAHGSVRSRFMDMCYKAGSLVSIAGPHDNVSVKLEYDGSQICHMSFAVPTGIDSRIYNHVRVLVELDVATSRHAVRIGRLKPGFRRAFPCKEWLLDRAGLPMPTPAMVARAVSPRLQARLDDAADAHARLVLARSNEIKINLMAAEVQDLKREFPGCPLRLSVHATDGEYVLSLATKDLAQVRAVIQMARFPKESHDNP